MTSLKKNVKFFDVRHTIKAGMITYKGLPGSLICDFLSREEAAKKYAEGETFQIESRGHILCSGFCPG